MYLDVRDLRDFYNHPLGRIVQSILVRNVRTIWPSLTHERVLGFGYATPIVRELRARSERVLAFMPRQQGVIQWPRQGTLLTSLVDEEDLPLGDSSIDRIVLLHSLEHSENPTELLREIWRVLTPGGRVILIVPHRRGLWARVETTPFGYGRPFSRAQLRRLLDDALLTPHVWNTGLYMAPSSRSVILRLSALLERFGPLIWPAFAGVHIVEAEKQMMRGLPVSAKRRMQPLLRPVLVPNARVGDCREETGPSGPA